MDDRREPPVYMLHDDLVINCLARVPRFYYPTLSVVSNRFRSLVASRELYQTRTFLGRTESCLYLCLRTVSNLLQWFILSQRPDSSREVLVPISSPNITSACVLTVVGSNIYAIGGGSEYNPSCSVMLMDSRSYTWREAPSMRVARAFPSACTLDGKLFVTGGCKNLDSTNWTEVFDTKTQTWEFLQIPSEELCRGSKYQSLKYEGTVYMRSKEKNATYKLHKGRWRAADIAVNMGLGSSETCVIEDVLYACRNETIRWYDLKDRHWKLLKGLEGLPSLPFLTMHVKLVDHGGKMMFLWEDYNHARSMIWCAEIALEKSQNGEIWGAIESCENLFTSDGPTHGLLLVHALTATV